MSFRKCIDDAVNEGALTQDQAKEARDLFDELEEQYQGKMNNAAAQSQAGLDTFNALQRKTTQRKRQKSMQLRTWQQITRNLDDYRTSLGEQDIYKAALSHFEQDGNSRFSSVAQREEAIKGEAFGEMSKILGTFRRNTIGEVRQKAKLKNVVREIFGEDTGDISARELAQSWRDASELLRKRFNRAGGAIPKRLDWGLPQSHDMLEVRKAGYETWRDFVTPRLDRTKMIDENTGLAFSDQKLEVVLRDVFETIQSDGMNKLTPGGASNGKSLGNRRQDHRFLSFADADSWMQYQEKFGNPNSFDTMISHVTNMSRDIAQLEILGPNPNATITFLKQTLSKKSSGDVKAENKARSTAKKIDELYMAITGRNNEPVNGVFAATMAGTRQILQSAQLGSAAISAITDLNFQRMARSFAGIPQTSTITQYLDLLNPLGAKEKGELAIRLGLIAEGWTSLAAGQMRYVGDISGPEITRRTADFVMRASLLSPLTSAGRWAFGMEFLGTIASNANKRFADLDPNFKRTFERYGFDEQSWDIIRNTQQYEERGAKFLRPADIRSRTDISSDVAESLTTRVLEMVNTETNFAVPSSSIRGRVALTADSRPGTIAGEITRSFAMYKNFGVTLVNTHLVRGMTQQGLAGKGAYFTNLLISTTLMGALALQLKEMSKGRDPRPMNTEDFWGAAFMQGGGLGIYGDFLFSDVNRYERGLAETIAGPTVGFANDIRKLTIGNLLEVAKGEDTKAASEFIKFTGRYAPGSSIWYLRLGLERNVLDQLQLWADPKAGKKMRKMERRFRKDYGQDYWWGTGETSPERKPRLENIFGN